MTKYIFVTGGVVSGLGKGITAASLGRPRCTVRVWGITGTGAIYIPSDLCLAMGVSVTGRMVSMRS